MTAAITIYGCAPDEGALARSLAPQYGVEVTLVDAPLSLANVAVAEGSTCVSVDHRTAVPHLTLLGLRRAGVRYLSTRSVGFDHIDADFARSIGIEVGNVAYSPEGVADYTLLLMLMALREAVPLARSVERHDYRLRTRSRELPDLTVGVIGTGRIGSAVLTRLRGFGSQVLTYDVVPSADTPHVPLEELLRRSDVVTLHAPLTDASHHLLNADRIGQMKPDALLVNTARGALVDTAALIDALESGHLGGAALDVVEGESAAFGTDRAPDEDSFLARLQQLPNAIVSPHTAHYTDRALHDTVENTFINCCGFMARFDEESACLG